jgi:Fic-DOC domain mobile mystery protein B
MGLDLEYIDGQTPLDEEEKEGLLIQTITTRGELDEFEQQNIEEAVFWYLSKSFKPNTLFTEQFICNLHKRMYGNVWEWAGTFRKTNKNIGVDKHQIPMQLKYLLDDAKYWLTNNTYSPDEFAIRFKHRLVSIHCFANGNGRHSRLVADIIIEKLFKMSHYSWGAANLVKQGDSRKVYITVVRAADAGDIQPLISFARS